MAAEQVDAADNAYASQRHAACNPFHIFGCKSEDFGYHVLVPGKAASVMPLFDLALPLISGVR